MNVRTSRGLRPSPRRARELYETLHRGRNSELELRPEHHAPRRDELGGLAEARRGAEAIPDAFVGAVVEQIQKVAEERDAHAFAEADLLLKADVEDVLVGYATTPVDGLDEDPRLKVGEVRHEHLPGPGPTGLVKEVRTEQESLGQLLDELKIAHPGPVLD